MLCISSIVIGQNRIAYVDYWFNDDFNNKKTLPISSGQIDADNTVSLDISFPDDGNNRLGDYIHYQFKDGAGNYSSIQSRRMYANTTEGSAGIRVQYWFDAFEEKKEELMDYVLGKETTNEYFKNIDWPVQSDSIFYRFKTKYGTYTHVLYKAKNELFATDSLTYVEYWYDSKLITKDSIKLALTSQDSIVDVDIPFGDGKDTIFYRIKTARNTYSPVYRKLKTQLPLSDAQIVAIEYWFDEGKDSSTTVDVNPINNDIGYNIPIDFTKKRINYRFKSKSGNWSYVQSKDIGSMPRNDNYIVKAEYWVNDRYDLKIEKTGAQGDIYSDRKEITLKDTSSVIRVRYQDRFGNWSSIYTMDPKFDLNDTKAPQGTLMLNSVVEGTKVKLYWNSVENAELYQLYRNGKYLKSTENTNHPTTFLTYDFPTFETHNYQVYAKNFESTKYLSSNIRTETLVKPQVETEKECGDIRVMVRTEYNDPIKNVKIEFSHDNNAIISSTGQYRRSCVPFGTKGQVIVSKNGYTFSQHENYPSSYNIDKNGASVLFIGQPNESIASNNNFEYLKHEIITDEQGYTKAVKFYIKKIAEKRIEVTRFILEGKRGNNINILDVVPRFYEQYDKEGVTTITFEIDKYQNLESGQYTLNIKERRQSNYNNASNLPVKNSKIFDASLNFYAPKSKERILADLKSKLESYKWLKDHWTGNRKSLIDRMANEIISEAESKALEYSQKSSPFDKWSYIDKEILHTFDLIESERKGYDTIEDYWQSYGKIIGYVSGPLSFIEDYWNAGGKAIQAIKYLEKKIYATQLPYELDYIHFKFSLLRRRGNAIWPDKYYGYEHIDNLVEKVILVKFDDNLKVSQEYPLSEVGCPIKGDYVCYRYFGNSASGTIAKPGDELALKVILREGKVLYYPVNSDYYEWSSKNLGNNTFFNSIDFDLDSTDSKVFGDFPFMTKIRFK